MKNSYAHAGITILLWILASFFLTILFQECSDKDPVPSPVFDPMIGHWTFDADSVSADFAIIDFQGHLAIDNESGGSYKTPSGTDIIVHKTPVVVGDSPWYIPILKLQGDDNEMLVFTNGELSNDFSSITFRSFQYVDMDKPSEVVNGVFVISKVKE